MDIIKTDQSPGGLSNNLNAAASHLLPYDPVQNKITDHLGNNHDSMEISELTGKEVGVYAFGTKKGIVNTGVYLQYHNSNN